MEYNFATFLKRKGFTSKKYPNDIRVFEYEKEREDKEKVYFAITIHQNNLMTCGRSDKEGLYCIDEKQPQSNKSAVEFFDKFTLLYNA